MHPFENRPVLPEPTTDLDGVQTVADALALTERCPDHVSVEETKGVGPYWGKEYVRFDVVGPVRVEGRLYECAASKKPASKEGGVVEWRTGFRVDEQVTWDLYEEYEERRARWPELAERADCLFEMLAEELEKRSCMEGDRPRRVWLTICDALISVSTGRSFRTHIFSRSVSEAVGAAFGISDWLELADVEIPGGG